MIVMASWVRVGVVLAVAGVAIVATTVRAIAFPPAHRPHVSAVPISPTVRTRASGVYLGVWQRGMPTNLRALTTFERDAGGKHIALAMFWRAMGGSNSALQPDWLRAIAQHGSVPVISWTASNWDPGSSQALYTLDSIVARKLDPYIRKWAHQLRVYGRPVLLRWGHEMNGNWYSWGQQPAKYIAAYRHIHDIFSAAGASNVGWVWSPNTWYPNQSFLWDGVEYYPGDRYVDWMALDGYNTGQNGGLSFHQIFDYSYANLALLSQRPIMIAETSALDTTMGQTARRRTKAAWITDAFRNAIPSMPRIKAVVWFNEDKTPFGHCSCNWTIESSRAAQAAFARSVASPYYLSRIPSKG